MSFCPNLKNKQVKQEFEELVSIFGEDIAYLLWNKNNGYSLDKAPNGAESILYKSLLSETKDREQAFIEKAKTYSQSFKSWFQDSKAIDENGEPLVLFHGTDTSFDTFQYDLDGSHGRHLVHNPKSFFFTDTHEKAFKYKQSIVMPVYLSIQNPGISSVKDGKYKTIKEYTDRENEIIKDEKYDSAIFVRYDKEGDNHGTIPTTQWVAKYPNQIKSINNNGEFSTFSNIYKSKQANYGLRSGEYDRLSGIPRSGDINTLIEYANNRRRGINSQALKLAFEICEQYFSERNSDVKYEIVENAEFAGQYDEKTNTIIINKTALFRNENKSPYPEIQTIVHELLHAVTVNAIKNDSRIRHQFQELLEKTKQSLGDKANDYGLENVYEFISELSNAEFVEKLKQIQYSPRQTLLERLKTILKKIYNQLYNSYKGFIGSGTVYSNAIEDLLGVLSYSENKFDNIVDTSLNTDKLYSISSSATQEQIDNLHQRVLRQYERMYGIYAKMNNKSPNVQGRQDKLWETIQELKQKENKEVSEIALRNALQNIGIVTRDTFTNDIIPSPKNTILGYFQYQQTTNFSNETAGHLHDIHDNIISFYKELYSALEQEKGVLDSHDQHLLETLNNSLQEISRLQKQAINVVGDKIVDSLVDKFLYNQPESERDKIKQVSKDWLHKNEMYGDLSTIEKFVRYSRTNSPIIKQAFALIQEAEHNTRKKSLEIQKKIIKAFNQADSILNDVTLGNWQTELMERYATGAKKGQFTGNFRSALNIGQFKEDQRLFMEQLAAKFINQYGYYYQTDSITGQVTRSDTGASVEEEQYSGPNSGGYTQWRLETEKWLCDHSERRYTFEYYSEMLSQPYDPKTRKGHGLSPKAMSRMNYIQQQLNYILQKAIDETGMVKPELLSKNDRVKYKMWQDALQDIGNPFATDGELKTGDDFQIALEIQAWNKFLQENTKYDTFYDKFDARVADIQDKISKGEATQHDLYDFVEMNSNWGINPEFLDFLFQGNQSAKDQVIAMFQHSMKGLIKTNNGYIKDFHNVILTSYDLNGKRSVKVSDMIKWARRADEASANSKQSTMSKDEYERLQQYVSFEDVQYTNPAGQYYDKRTKTYFKAGEPGHKKEDVMTWFEYVLEEYTDAAMDGRMSEYISSDGQTFIDFQTFNGDRDAIKSWISDNILTFEKYSTGKSGITTVKRVPLSIFTQMIPKVNTFGPHNKPTSRFVPKGSQFTSKNNLLTNGIKLYNNNFNTTDGSQIQPKFSIYGDQDIVDMLAKGGKKAEYYKLLLDSMNNCWKQLGLNPIANRFKLPQIEGTQQQKNSRLLKNPKQWLKNLWENISGVTSDDLEGRSNDDYVERNGKWIINSIPTRFITNLKDPNMINSDLASTVSLFVEMANRYQEKSKIQPLLEVLRYNLQSENRESQYKSTGNLQNEIYDSMMRRLFYESNINNASEGVLPSRTSIAMQKLTSKLRGYTAFQKLALNIPSMLNGFFDSLTQLPSIAARDDVFNQSTLVKAMFKTLPNLITAFFNIGNPIPNCKAVAMMQKDNLITSSRESNRDVYRNRFSKGLEKIMMGGYTLGDYMVTMLLQRCVYDAKLYYPGSINVKEGFYTKNDLKKLLGQHMDAKTVANEIRRGNGVTLWSAHEFKNGVAQLKPQYQHLNQGHQEAAAIEQISALIAGKNPDNDMSFVSNSIMYKMFFLLRSYIISRAEHMFCGAKPENIVKEKEETVDIHTHNSSVYTSRKTTWKKLTEEQKATRTNFDYSTGQANPALFVQLFRGAQTTMRKLAQALSFGLINRGQNIKFNPSEIKALREAVMFLGILGAMSIGFIAFHGYADESTKDLKPDKYEDSLPSVENFTKQKVYLKLLDNVAFRVIDSQAQSYNTWQVIDMIKNATTVTSAIDDWSTSLSIIANPDNLTDIVQSDSRYKYYPKWQKALWTSIGPLNNMQKWATWRGNDKTERWYFDNTVTGNLLKQAGVTYRADDSSNYIERYGQYQGFANNLSNLSKEERDQIIENQKLRDESEQEHLGSKDESIREVKSNINDIKNELKDQYLSQEERQSLQLQLKNYQAFLKDLESEGSQSNAEKMYNQRVQQLLRNTK